METIECLCGECRECRAYLREPPNPAVETTLGELAQSILAEGVGFVPDKPRRSARRIVTTTAGTWQERDVAKRREKREEHKAERVMVDGHWEHPRAPHGTTTGTSLYCCCCPTCRKYNADRARGYHQKKRAKEKNAK